MISPKAKLSSHLYFAGFRVPFGIAHRHSRTQSLLARNYATTSSAAAEAEKPPPPLKNPFPYPSTSRPTPHQIFHLSLGATQAEIKTRYYELVKVHHPDSQYAGHLSPDIAHARFRAIQAAYDFLRGKTLSPHPNARPSHSPTTFDPYMHEMARRRRAYYAYHSGYPRDDEGERWAKPGWGEGFGAPASQRTVWHKDGWRERMVLAFGVMTLLAGLFPSMPFTIASMFVGSAAGPTSYVVSSSSSSASLRKGPESSSDAPASSSNSANSFSIPFIDLDKNHREAASALHRVRNERKEIGPERREEMRKRVREMTMTDAQQLQSQPCPSSASGGEDLSEGVMPTGPTDTGPIGKDNTTPQGSR